MSKRIQEVNPKQTIKKMNKDFSLQRWLDQRRDVQRGVTRHGDLINPHQKITKLNVAAYYKSVAPWLLRHMKNRPLSLLRFPDQSGQNCFFQNDTTENRQLTDVHQIKAKDQRPSYINNESGLLQLVQWGVLEIQTWQSHKDEPLLADQIVFDLDPDPAVKWFEVKRAALQMKILLERLGLKAFLKTTGGKGLHLHVPIAAIYHWHEIKAFTRSVALELESRWPNRYTADRSKNVHKGKIFVDYLRNDFGATVIAPYSLRSTEATYVAMPLDWGELPALKSPRVFDIKKTLHRLAYQKSDPWGNYSSLKQEISNTPLIL